MRKKHQGMGKIHISKIQETNKKIIECLQKIDSFDVNDNKRGIRSIQRATKIDGKVLIKRLDELRSGGKILEVGGSNRRRLFCLNNEKNRNKIKSDESRSDTNPYDLRGECVKERTELIQFLNDVIAEHENIQKQLEDPNITVENVQWPEKFQIIRDLFYSERPTWKKMRDGRQKLLPQMRPILTALSSVATNSDIAKNYFPQIVKQFIIPDDRFIEFLEKVKTNQDFIEFIQQDPWNWGFLDMECPSCGKFGLKTSLNDNYTWDLVCKNSDGHGGKESHFSAELYTKWCEDLKTNRNETATKYLSRYGIVIHSY